MTATFTSKKLGRVFEFYLRLKFPPQAWAKDISPLLMWSPFIYIYIFSFLKKTFLQNKDPNIFPKMIPDLSLQRCAMWLNLMVDYAKLCHVNDNLDTNSRPHVVYINTKPHTHRRCTTQ